jgi:hypothetical protein
VVRLPRQGQLGQCQLDHHEMERFLGRGVLAHPGHFYDFPADGEVVLSLLARESDFARGLATLM